MEATSDNRPASGAAARPEAVIARGEVRFTVLTPRLLRLEWSATGAFRDGRTQVVVHRALDVPPFTLVEDDRFIEIDTGVLRLRYEIGRGRFDAANLAILVRRDAGDLTGIPVTRRRPTSAVPTARSTDTTATPGRTAAHCRWRKVSSRATAGM